MVDASLAARSILDSYSVCSTHVHNWNGVESPCRKPISPIQPPSTILGVYLRAGGKLTQNVTWWALRIPAPAPVVTDDAGHRYYPKTAAFPLLPAEYNIVLDIPLAALTKEERKIAVRVKVVKAPKLDAGQ